MALALPPGHPRSDLAAAGAAATARRRALRVGIVNIMPRLEEYEASLLAPLAAAEPLVEPVLIRLEAHGYQSSDHQHLDRFYRPYGAALLDADLDGLIVTGAPVEEMAFEAVHYWRELEQILAHARAHVACTLGLCWGGLALGRVLGVEKRALSPKVFGVFEDEVLVPSHDLVSSGSGRFPCAHSRHSGVAADELEQAASKGVLRPLSWGERTGYSTFESADGRFVAHLGHPEYEGARLAFEWDRDRHVGRPDVHAPANLDLAAPATTWRDHRASFFSGFLARAAAGVAAR